MAYVTVRPDDEVIHVADAETILGGLAKAGFTYRVGCRRGGCGICKVTLVEGRVTYERPIASAVLTDEERADGTCCRAGRSRTATSRSSCARTPCGSPTPCCACSTSDRCIDLSTQ
jgi:ferredoxin